MQGKFSAWDDKYPFLFVILRVILGLILAIRGVFFLTSIQPLFHLIKSSILNELNIDKFIRCNIYYIRIFDENI